jgi:ATP phosphoribosyltransferase
MRKLGIPSGSLQDSTIKLLEKVGIGIRVNGRQFKIEIKNFSLFSEVIIMRPQDIPKAVADGLLDAGLCGWDWVVESEMDQQVEKIGELWYGKKTREAVKVVVIGKSKELRDGPDVRVTSRISGAS